MMLHRKFELAFAHAERYAAATGRRMRVFRHVIERPAIFTDRHMPAGVTYWAIQEVGA